MSTVLAETQGYYTDAMEKKHKSTTLAKKQRHYTYATFPWEELREGKLAELIEGEIMFFNAPQRMYQKISVELVFRSERICKARKVRCMPHPLMSACFLKTT